MKGLHGFSATLLEALRSALRSIFSNKLRAFLTLLGITIGIAATILVVSLSEGLRGSILASVKSFAAQPVSISPKSPSSTPAKDAAKIRKWGISEEDYERLRRVTPQIRVATSIVRTSGTVELMGREGISTSLLLTDQHYLDINSLNLDFGRNFLASECRSQGKVAILGGGIAQKLGGMGTVLGKIINIGNLSLEVVGIIQEKGTMLGADLFVDDEAVVIPLSTGISSVSEKHKDNIIFQTLLAQELTVEEGASLIEKNLRQIQGIKGDEHNNFTVHTPKQTLKLVDNITIAMNSVGTALVSISLLVGGIGIMNIMLVTVIERTPEIGIRRAVGAQRIHILLQFLLESVLISLMGGLIGAILGQSVGIVITKFVVGQIAIVPLWAVLAAVAIPVIIGVIFGIYPAFQASKLNTIDALRHE